VDARGVVKGNHLWRILTGENWSVSGSYTITWSGNGGQAYTVLYTPDGVQWRVLALNITSTTLDVFALDLPGGDAARIQVYATDGIKTAIDISDGDFSVALKPPEAFILSPKDHSVILPGMALYVKGLSSDAQDGTLTGDALHWTMDDSVDLGTGSLVLVDVPYGMHTIDLTVTNSKGITDKATIHVISEYRVLLPAICK
jgi:hypothetical protein